MDNGGVLLYKCRRCGAIVEDVHVPDILRALTLLTIGGETPKEWGGNLTLTELHNCMPQHIGVCDLIGGKTDNAT